MAKLRPTRAFMKRLEFLSTGKLYLKDSVKAITLSYNVIGRDSAGMRKFIKEKLPPIQFRNSSVQVLLFKNTGKPPFVNIYFGDGSDIALDVEGKKAERILQELSSVAAKSEVQVKREQQKQPYNPANFGDSRRGRLCMCEVPGQVPCPSKVPMTNVVHSWHEKDSSVDT